jgi:hypothetical protein
VFQSSAGLRKLLRVQYRRPHHNFSSVRFLSLSKTVEPLDDVWKLSSTLDRFASFTADGLVSILVLCQLP